MVENRFSPIDRGGRNTQRGGTVDCTFMVTPPPNMATLKYVIVGKASDLYIQREPSEGQGVKPCLHVAVALLVAPQAEGRLEGPVAELTHVLPLKGQG